MLLLECGQVVKMLLPYLVVVLCIPDKAELAEPPNPPFAQSAQPFLLALVADPNADGRIGLRDRGGVAVAMLLMECPHLHAENVLKM